MEHPDELRILVVDDDNIQLRFMKKCIESITSLVCAAEYFTEPVEAMEAFGRHQFDLVIADYHMPGLSGLDILTQVKAAAPTVPVVIMTAGTELEKVIHLMKSGAYDFMVKPFDASRLESLFIRVEGLNSLEREVRNLRERVDRRFSITSIIGNSKPVQQVIETIGRCAEHSVNVLVRGESGTGKELVANALHYTSPRKNGPFVVVNIAALPESLVESELFGHVKGAFTGADKDRAGRFEEANGGTLFIDEIGDVSQTIQVKLLRAIQFKQFQRIGENAQRESNTRIIAATSRNLEEMMASGEFRTDLYYRLNVVGITVPSLRDRREDIPALVEHFLAQKAEETGLPAKTVSKEAMHRLVTYDYPGNIRELQNTIEHAMVFSRTSLISTRDLPEQFAVIPDDVPFEASSGSRYESAMDGFETSLLRETLEANKWNQSAAARSLGINERRLRYRMEKLGLASPE